MVGTIFEYPELCHILSNHLSLGDMAACLLVNKRLYSNFLPYIYKSIIILDYTHCLPYSVEKTIEDQQISRMELLKSLVELPQADISDMEPLPRYSPSLSCLRLHGHLIESLTLIYRTKFMTPPKNNSNKNEKNNNPPEIPPWEQQNDTFIKILRTCRLYGLKTLVIRGLAQSIPSRPSYGECGTSAMWRMQFERFERDRDRSFAQIIKAAAAIITDANVTLTATSTTTTTATATSSEKVIEKQTGGIQRLVISNTTGFSSKSLAMILETSLSTTLEELDVQRCGYFRSEEMHFALSKLPNLKVVDFRCREKIPIITPYSGLLPKRLAEEEEKAILGNIKQPQKTTTAMMASTTTADGFPIIPPALWACRTSLRSLRIGVTNASIQKYNYDRNDLCIGFRIWIRGAETYWLEKHPETEKQYPEDLHWFFDQIATLTQLRELCLVAVKPEHHKTRSLELSLKTGLDRWSTLTALECLDVEELDHGIGLEDVQWMVESWPALKMIRGLVHEKDETPTDAVLWLKKARPDIELPISKVLRGMDALEAYYDEDDL